MARTRIATAASALLLALAFATPLSAQKFGYANANLILTFLPEVENVEKQIQTYQQKLMQNINVKTNYLQTKFQEYQDLVTSGSLTEEERTQREQELQRLQQEVEDERQAAQVKSIRKEEELLTPLLEKVYAAIQRVADREGYTYVFNTSTGGSSVLLVMPDEDNLTRRVLTELGITVTDEELENGPQRMQQPAGGAAGTTTPLPPTGGN